MNTTHPNQAIRVQPPSGAALAADLGVRTSYRSSDFNQNYRTCLERSFGIALRREPVEAWRKWRGYEVHLDEWSPDGPARGTVLLIHGGGGNGRLLAPFANAVAGLGFRAIAPDLPGYGLTRVPLGHRVDYADWLDLLVDITRLELPKGPVFLFGLSVGGMTAAAIAQRVPEVRGVVATTLLDLSDAASFDATLRFRSSGPLLRALFRAVPRFVDAMSTPLRWMVPVEQATSDAVLGRLLYESPLIGRRRVSSQLFRTMVAAAPPNRDIALPCPLLVAHPGSDEWTPPEFSLRTFDRVVTEKQYLLLPNGGHIPLEPLAFGALTAAVATFFDRALGVPSATRPVTG